MDYSVSIIIPMYNARETITKVLEAILNQEYDSPYEVIVVDDGNTDNSLELASRFLNKHNLTIINQLHKGAAAATNKGISAAQYDIVCSIDSDVVVYKDWLGKIIAEFNDERVAAVQGNYTTPNHNMSLLARMAGYDFERRYDDIKEKYVTHVDTGNTAYRRSALEKVGLFDTSFIYAYDNDMSYRLLKKGYLLVFKKDAFCDHYWKSNIKSYIRQQFWSGYGRMQVIQKHKGYFLGDTMSGARMILQVPATLFSIAFIITGGVVYFFNRQPYLLTIGIALLAIILIDRLIFTMSIIKKQNDFFVIILPFVHLLRNIVWCWALLKWSFNQLSLSKNEFVNVAD